MNDIIGKFLKKNISPSAHKVNFLSKGMFSSAYSFEDDDQIKIIRLNETKSDFLKDKFARRFATENLPIPEIQDIGKFNSTFYYAISNKCPGVIYNALDIQRKQKLIPKIATTLLALHNIDISNFNGFGNVDERFIGKFNSWGFSLLNLENHKISYDWNVIFSRKFFDNDIYKRLGETIKNNLKYLPQKRYLVHGDFGFDNLIVHKNRITGVIDWAEARLGDFLYDIAWLNFWSEDIDYSQIIKLYYEKSDYDLRHQEERLQCYYSVIGLNSLILSAHLNNSGDYSYVLGRLNKL